MKELLERIKKLQEEIQGDDHHLTIFKDVKPNDVLVRNSPKVIVYFLFIFFDTIFKTLTLIFFCFYY